MGGSLIPAAFGVLFGLAYSGSELIRSISYLTEWALGSKSQSAATPGPATTDHANTSVLAPNQPATPFNLAFDTQLAFFLWLETQGNEGRLVRFGHGMTGSRAL